MDLQTGETTLEIDELRPAFEHAVRDHHAAVGVDREDLAARQPGQAARAQADERRREAPFLTLAARALGVHTQERAWRLGAVGEQKVSARLARLPEAWQVLHALPVGDRGADIDHLVIGPAGVFTINAKHHPNASVWVAGDTFLVNGARQPYVRNSRHEAARASARLSLAVGFPVTAMGVVAVVGAGGGFTVKQQPDGVHVIARRRIHKWLAARPPILSPEQVAATFEVARRSETWR